MPYADDGTWYDEAGGDGTNLFENAGNTAIPPNYGSYMPGTTNTGTNTGTNWSGAGTALAGSIGELGKLQQTYNQARAPGIAAGQMVAGSQAGLESINNLYGQTSGLNLPFIQAGAGVGNAIQANTNPYIGAGQQAIGSLQDLQAPLNVNQFLDPSMAFTLKQGMDAAQRSQAARGGLLSGAAMKDLTGYASGLASQNYNQAVQNAFQNRTQQANIGAQLYGGGLQGIGLQTPVFQGGVSALGFQNQNAIGTGNQTAQLYQNIGQAQAGGTVQGSKGPSDLQQVGQAVDVGTKLYDLWENISAESTKTSIQPMQSAQDLQQYQQQVQQPQAQPVQAAQPPAQFIPTPATPRTMQQQLGDTLQGVVARANPQGGAFSMQDMLHSFFSDEDTKEDIRNLSEADVNKSLDGMKAKSYEYKQSAQRDLGVPPGRRAGVMAEDVKRTPAGGMVNNTEPLSINIPKAVSFSLAATAALNKRLSALEKGGK